MLLKEIVPMLSITKRIHPNKKDLEKTDIWMRHKLKSLEEETRSTVLMAGNELLENAVKYHMEKNITSRIIFKMSINDKISLEVTNRLCPGDDVHFLLDHINRINTGSDPILQYQYRLKEIMEKRIPGESRLGLLRIAGEGNFRIGYNLSDDHLSIKAGKFYRKKRDRAMESLITKDFSIEIKGNNPLEILWSGKSRDLNPSLVIDKYLDELMEYLYDREVVVDFTSMESLNSSTIPPILTFLSNLEKKMIRTDVRYSRDIYWQRASFKPLSVLIRDFRFVKIQSV